MSADTEISTTELKERYKELARPGIVFGQPYHEGHTTIITASMVQMRGDQLVSAPVGVVLIGPKGVELRRFDQPAVPVLILAMVAAIVFWLAMLLHPAWKPDSNLVDQLSGLVKTIRQTQNQGG